MAKELAVEADDPEAGLGRLLKIVEVDEARKVKCQAEGCGHAVWRRIHVVEDQGNLMVMGGDCFDRLFGGAVGEACEMEVMPERARALNQEEAELLATNTAVLVERLREQEEREMESREAAERERAELSQMRIARMHEDLLLEQQRRAEESRRKETIRRALEECPSWIRQEVERSVNQELCSAFGIDVRLPGWAGWYRCKVEQEILARLGVTQRPGTIQADVQRGGKQVDGAVGSERGVTETEQAGLFD